MGGIVKIVLVGLAWALGAAVLTLVVEIAFIAGAFHVSMNEGTGGLGAVSVSMTPTFIAAILGFAFGAWRQFRKIFVRTVSGS